MKHTIQTHRRRFPLSLLTLGLLVASQGWAQQKDETVETIEVTGQRNSAQSEVTAETQKLLEVAGLNNDPLNAVYSLPGVVYAGGDNGGEPAIRGSSPDDNAFYIDGLPADYIFHLFGDSIFNKNLVRDFNLYPAAFNSTYGNAIGGVFDVQLRDPRNQPIGGTVDVGFIKSGILVEGGVTDNQAFYASYRRSQIHLYMKNNDEVDPGIRVYRPPVSDDYQAKYQWLLGQEHKITLSATGASDVGALNVDARSEAGRADPDSVGDWEFRTRYDNQNLQWEYFPGEHQYFSVLVNHMTAKARSEFGSEQYAEDSGKQYNLRIFYKNQLFDDHQLSIGVDVQSEKYDYTYDAIPYYCTDHDADCLDRKGERIQDTDNLKQQTLALYVSDLWQINPDWQLELGLRAEKNDYTDQQFIHPRARLNWMATNQLGFFLQAGTYSRFPDAGKAIKLLGNPDLKSPESTHVAAGVEYQLFDTWHSRAEIYMKDISKLPRATDPNAPNADLHYTNDLSGKAHGIEIVVEKERVDNWYGWLSLSYSKSDRTDQITRRTTEYYLDTPLMANLVGNYQLNDKWTFSGRLTVRSGAKYTPIVGIEPNPDYPDNYQPVYGELNSKTLPVYHRLDLEARYKFNMFRLDAELSLALLNALGAKNISGYYFAPDGNETPSDYRVLGEKGMEPFPAIGLTVNF